MLEKINRLGDKLEEVLHRYDELKLENQGLHERVSQLEAENARLGEERELVKSRIEELVNKID